MTPAELVTRVTRETCVAAALRAAPAAWLGGPAGAAGVLAGGALALVNFRSLAARAVAATGGGAGGPAWAATAGLRFIASLAAGAALLATGWAHPVALLAGFTVLPCAVIRLGLADARKEG